MQGQNPGKQTQNRIDPERTLALITLSFLILEILLITLTLANALKPPVAQTQPPLGSEPITPPDPGDPTVIPVFSGGVVPATPRDGANTVALGGEVASANAILVNVRTGEVLASKNPDEQFSPASLTKVMTLIVACEQIDRNCLQDRLTLTQELTDYVTSGSYYEASCSLIDGDKYLGDEFLIRDLLFGIGVESAADCTMMIAQYVCPAATPAESEAAFVALMNQKARQLNLNKTVFDNVIGHESQGNLSTARELAVITAYAMQSDLIAEILGVTTHSYFGYYLKDGVPASYPRLYQSTLFKSRMETYQRYTGTAFKLTSAKLTGGKTGSFVSTSYMTCTLRGSTTGEDYVLVLGAAEKVGAMPASIGTMRDIKLISDTYVK